MFKTEEEESRFVEAFTVRMNQVMNARFNAMQAELLDGLRKDIRQRVPQRYQFHEPPRCEWSDQRHERRHMEGSRERRSFYGKEAVEQFNQNHPQQPSKLHQQKETPPTLHDLDEELKEAFKAWRKSLKKNKTPCPSSEAITTKQEPSCSTEETVDQREETDQPLLVCKGMDENSNSDLCANELFLCHEENNPEVYLELEDVEPKYDTYDEGKTNLEPPTSPEPESFPKSLSDDLQRHCKELNLIKATPNLFVLVSVEEEKQFGLERVKEICVPGFFFDKLISPFSTFELEKSPRQTYFLFNELCDSDIVLSHHLIRNTLEHELFPKEQDFVLDKWFSKLDQFLSFSRRDLHNSISIKASFDIIYLLIFDYFDMICLPWPKVSYAGFGSALKRKQGTLKREEDKRFKPPDLDQDEHPDATHSMLIKHEPPDATSNPTPSLNKLEDHVDSRTNPFEEGGDDVILPTPGRTYIHINPRIDQDAVPISNPTLDQTCTRGFADVLGSFIMTFLILLQPP